MVGDEIVNTGEGGNDETHSHRQHYFDDVDHSEKEAGCEVNDDMDSLVSCTLKGWQLLI